mgnify:CR=1 FL=1
MWRSVSFSEGLGRAALIAGLALAAFAGPGWAAELLGVGEALTRAFPAPAVTSRQTLYLDEAQAKAVSRAAGSPLPSRVVTCYEARESGDAGAPVIGWACLDTHVVRTLPETLLVVVDAELEIRRVDVLAFKEPRDYLLPRRWLEQLRGQRLDEELALKRGLHAMSGATISARSATRAARRVLALVEQQLAPPERGPKP